MLRIKHHNWLFLTISALLLAGCGDAKTTIIEKDPIVEEEHDHDHEHEGHGRLVVTNASSAEAVVYALEDGTLLDSFTLLVAPSALYTSAGYRYGVLVDRNGDSVGFIDGGLWQEDHVDHLHDYEEAPLLLEYSLSGSRPTHIVNHEEQLAVFYDGDAASSTPASISIVTDADITAATSTPLTIDYSINMHGVAEPRGDHVFATWRRDDAETTSANPVLPDQVAVYHLHDGVYEQEQILDVSCPDLHGAAQNETYIIFGCSDGVLVVHEHDGEFEAEKIPNSEDVADGLRIGSIYGHEHSEQFIGLASAHGGASVQWFSINPEEGEMELIDWQPVESAQVVGRGFSFEAEQFLILDSQGYLTALEPHEHEGHTHWEFGVRLDITEEDVANLPEGTSFSLTFAQNGHLAYVSDPIAQHVLTIDLDHMDIDGEIELDFIPKSIAWLGIAEEHEHE
ncbi:hypothetical protein [Teredinibacter turnerae]|uniref:hypothetical protein n=1 Tax=Teredinibacter turnerae TaxID=2426 RepID=UPI00037A6DE0|nr:hypothetical protein [Teredinibacter turnerae]